MIDENNRVIGENSIAASKLGGFGKKKPDEQLLDLFWNRADLKKQYSGAKDDLYDLQNQLEEARKETRRVRDDMKVLENRLSDPTAAYNAMVYYQLRELWDCAKTRLETFSGELISQQKDRERKKQVMEFNQERQKRLQEIGARIIKVKEQSDSAKLTFHSIETKYNELTGMHNFFKRRRMRPSLDQNREEYEAVRERIEGLFDDRIKIESEQWPDYPGLSVEGKRVINIAVIALAQHLCVHYSENALSSLARTAVTQKLNKVDYGTKSDCEYLMNRIRDSIVSMEESRDFAGELKARSKYLRSRAEFRNDADTCPVADSVGGIPVSFAGQELGNTVAGMPLEINILAEDYWSLASVLVT